MQFPINSQLIPYFMSLREKNRIPLFTYQKLWALFNEAAATVLMYIFSEVKQIAFLQKCWSVMSEEYSDPVYKT
jgi:hypothetical protein